MPPIEYIAYGCEPLTSGNNGTSWTDATGEIRLRVQDGALVRDGGTTQCPLGPDTTAIFIAPGSQQCEAFRTLTEFTSRMQGLRCPMTTEPRALLTVLMRPLPVGHHDDIVVRIAATVDVATGVINCATGQAYLVRYEGRMSVAPAGPDFTVTYDLHRITDVAMFPAQLQGELHVARSALPFGVKLTTLPFTISGRGESVKLELVEPASEFVAQQLRRLEALGLRGPRFNNVRTVRQLAMRLQVDNNPRAVEAAITELIAFEQPAAERFLRTQLARLRTHKLMTPRLAKVTSVCGLAMIFQVDCTLKAVEAAITERITDRKR